MLHIIGRWQHPLEMASASRPGRIILGNRSFWKDIVIVEHAVRGTARALDLQAIQQTRGDKP
jgi:hypothetical protein